MNNTHHPRPTRYGHALRRLLAGKTSAINYRVAIRLCTDGLVTVPPGQQGATVRVELTEKGRSAALLAKKGVRLYDERGQPQHPLLLVARPA